MYQIRDVLKQIGATRRSWLYRQVTGYTPTTVKRGKVYVGTPIKSQLLESVDYTWTKGRITLTQTGYDKLILLNQRSLENGNRNETKTTRI